MRARATSKFIGLSPRKVRLVIDTVRGKNAKEALSMLKFMPQASSFEVAKVIKSAVANAENNYQMTPEDLFIHEIFVDDGPTMKRFRARARGRGDRILKRSSHITVVVDDKEDY